MILWLSEGDQGTGTPDRYFWEPCILPALIVSCRASASCWAVVPESPRPCILGCVCYGKVQACLCTECLPSASANSSESSRSCGLKEAVMLLAGRLYHMLLFLGRASPQVPVPGLDALRLWGLGVQSPLLSALGLPAECFPSLARDFPGAS